MTSSRSTPTRRSAASRDRSTVRRRSSGSGTTIEWGHGYATEAARACAEWGFRAFAYPYLTAMIAAENARSVRVAERLGMTRLRDDSLFDVPVVVHFVERRTFYAESQN